MNWKNFPVQSVRGKPRESSIKEIGNRLDGRFAVARGARWKVEATYHDLADAQEAWDALMNIGPGPVTAKQPERIDGVRVDVGGPK